MKKSEPMPNPYNREMMMKLFLNRREMIEVLRLLKKKKEEEKDEFESV